MRRIDADQVILVACVHYLDSERVSAYSNHVINEIECPPGWTVAVAVGDNSGGFSADSQLSGVSVFSSRENLGYLRGCALAATRWENESGLRPSWVLITGTDLQLDEEFFNELVSIDVEHDVAILAPDIIGSSGLHENPYQLHKPSRPRALLSVLETSTVVTAAAYSIAV